MKKIYLSHPINIDYKNLYKTLGEIKNVKFFFPHLAKPKKSKILIKKCSVIIADVSKPSYGVGIEIGWADSFGTPIILICKKGSKISSSLKLVSKNIIEYMDFDDAKNKIENELRGIKWMKK